MQKTCYNCHRTFNISNDDIARYESVQNYANTIFWQNTVNMGETGKQVNYKIQEQRRAQAIGSSVSNPYVCPYCGSDQNKEPVALDWLATLAIISWMLGFAAAIIALLFTITGDEGAYIFWLIAIPSIVWPFIVDSIQRQKINNRIQQQEAQQEAREAARQASKQKKQQKNQQKEYQSMKFGDIDWYILDKQKDKKLLISKYIVDCQPYNETKKKITWENCSLRKYLNSDFLYKHFNEEEKNKILLTDVINDNSKYKIKGGNNTKDKIFLLSRDEAKNYFSSKEMRVTCATSYAKSVNNELSVNSDNGNSCFWLRSPGNFLSSAAYVNSDGSVQGSGCCVDYHDYGIRPALWISC